MKFTFYKRRRKFSDYFRPRKKVVITYRITIGKLLGFGGGYVSNIRSDEKLTRNGDPKRLVEVIAREAKKQGLDVPFGIPYYALDDYDLKVVGWKPEVAMLDESSRRAGSRQQPVLSETALLNTRLSTFGQSTQQVDFDETIAQISQKLWPREERVRQTFYVTDFLKQLEETKQKSESMKKYFSNNSF